MCELLPESLDTQRQERHMVLLTILCTSREAERSLWRTWHLRSWEHRNSQERGMGRRWEVSQGRRERRKQQEEIVWCSASWEVFWRKGRRWHHRILNRVTLSKFMPDPSPNPSSTHDFCDPNSTNTLCTLFIQTGRQHYTHPRDARRLLEMAHVRPVDSTATYGTMTF
jgi:hypothetical protein